MSPEPAAAATQRDRQQQDHREDGDGSEAQELVAYLLALDRTFPALAPLAAAPGSRSEQSE